MQIPLLVFRLSVHDFLLLLFISILVFPNPNCQFCFYACAFGINWKRKNLCPEHYQESISHRLSLIVFYVSHCTFFSLLLHFVCESHLLLFFSTWISRIPNTITKGKFHPCWCIFLLPVFKVSLSKMHELISGFSILFHWSRYLSSCSCHAIVHRLWGFVVYFKAGYYTVSTFFTLLGVHWLFSVFWFP